MARRRLVKAAASLCGKLGCFHVVGASNAASALQKIAVSTMVVIAEGYATAVTIAKHANRLENNPGRAKRLRPRAAVKGVAIFPEFSAEQREQGLTDFNDLERAQPEVVSRQLTAAVSDTREGRTLRREHAPSMELAR